MKQEFGVLINLARGCWYDFLNGLGTDCYEIPSKDELIRLFQTSNDNDEKYVIAMILLLSSAELPRELLVNFSELYMRHVSFYARVALGEEGAIRVYEETMARIQTDPREEIVKDIKISSNLDVRAVVDIFLSKSGVL